MTIEQTLEMLEAQVKDAQINYEYSIKWNGICAPATSYAKDQLRMAKIELESFLARSHEAT